MYNHTYKQLLLIAMAITVETPIVGLIHPERVHPGFPIAYNVNPG
jgi:hypothetical protein